MKPGNSFGHLLNSLLVTSESQSESRVGKKILLNMATGMALRFMATQYNLRPSLRKYMKSADGWINFSVGFKTDTGSVEQAIIFIDGKVKVVGKIPDDIDLTIQFKSDEVLKEMARCTPNETLNLVLKNRMVLDGNMVALQVFNFFVSLILGNKHQKTLDKAHREDIQARKQAYKVDKPELAKEFHERKNYRMKGRPGEDPNVVYLEDPYLPEYSVQDFPRLERFYRLHFETTPEVCAERPKLMTDWFRENGFEEDNKGDPWSSVLRQAHAFKYLMENKKPIIQKDDLMAGATTSKEIGLTVFPDGPATMFWGELHSVGKRVLSPYICSEETANILHHEVFPFWMKRNFREVGRLKNK